MTLIQADTYQPADVKIYSDYDEEPQEHFLPLPETLYRELYDLEMSSFVDDFSFYNSNLQQSANILELGCGSGRLTRLLADAGHLPVGIDLSYPMLKEARIASPAMCRYICMDMRHLALNQQFDAIIIPYNTLNLLSQTEDVLACLSGCRNQLKTGGLLLLQLYIPTEDIVTQHEKSTFQFQMFDRPQGGKIIKEILRQFHADDNVLQMTERYKIRPMTPGQPNSNYSHTMTINAQDQATWLKRIESSGFTIESLFSSYTPTAASNPSLLLIKAIKR